MQFKAGNLIDQIKPGNIVVHGCNKQGVWGSGVAKMMKQFSWEAFSQYVSDCYHKNVDVSWHSEQDGSIIASAFTQEFYGKDGAKYVSYDAIDSCFSQIFKAAVEFDKEVHIPNMIGAGLGGGDQDVIITIINSQARKNKFPLDKIIVWTYVQPTPSDV